MGNCKNKNCGCQDTMLTSPAPCPTPVGCTTPPLCAEVFDANCVVNQGEDILCGDDTVASTGDSQDTINRSIVEYFCNALGNISIYTEVTYAEITNLITTNTLEPGSFYLITDFETIYIQPDWSDENTPKPIAEEMIKTGVIEPIVVQAISVNLVSPIAFSTTFPRDIIEYDIRQELLYSDGLGMDIYSKGKITKRTDEANNVFSFDFRNVKFKRYDKTTVPDLSNFDDLAYWDTGETASEHYIFRFKDCQLNTYQLQISNCSFLYEPNIEFPLENLGSEFGIWNINTTVYVDGNLIHCTLKGFIINTNLTFVYCSDFKLEGVSNNFYFQSSNTAKANHFSGIFDKVRIKNNNVQANEFQGDFREFYMAAGSEVGCYSNDFSGVFFDFTINGNPNRNNFVVREGKYVVINGLSVDNNTVKCLTFGASTLGQKVTYTSFENNEIILKANFLNNNITRINGSRFYGGSVTDNTGYGINACQIEENFSNNTLRAAGDITGLVQTTGDPYLTKCNFKTQINSIDLQPGKHIYNAYNTDAFLNINEELKLSHFDISNSLTVTDITD